MMLLDAASGKELQKPVRRGEHLTPLVFAPDGKAIVCEF
jgi:hypothetical protein